MATAKRDFRTLAMEGREERIVLLCAEEEGGRRCKPRRSALAHTRAVLRTHTHTHGWMTPQLERGSFMDSTVVVVADSYSSGGTHNSTDNGPHSSTHVSFS